MSEEIPTDENQSAQVSENVNPHSLGKQVTGLVAAAVVVIALFSLYGVVAALMGTFTFLDAWNSGIYKQSGIKTFSNLSRNQALPERRMSLLSALHRRPTVMPPWRYKTRTAISSGTWPAACLAKMLRNPLRRIP